MKVSAKLVAQSSFLLGTVIAACIAFTQPSEDTVLKAYWDSHGRVWTICDGYTYGVKQGDTETPEGCAKKTEAAHRMAADAVLRLTTTEIPVESFMAFEDFVYNVGAGNFAKSTMRKKINMGDLRGACGEFAKWVYAGGLDCRNRSNGCYGIVLRRQRQAAQCLKGVQ